MSMHDRMESMADLYVAGGLSADERCEADQHAAGCPSCAALLRDAREFAAWARGAIAPDAPPADLEDRLVASFRMSGPSKRRRFPVVKRILKVTGSIAAAVGLIFLGNVFSAHAGMGDLPVPDDSSKVVAGQELSIDGAWAEKKDGLAFYFGRDLGVEGRDKAWAHQGRGPDANVDRSVAALKAQAGEAGRYDERFAKLAENGKRTLVARGGGRAASEPQQPQTGATFGLGETEKLGELTKLNLELNRKDDSVESMGKDLKKVQEARKIIRNADVSLEVESYEATYTKLTEMVAAEKGQISAASTQKMANGKIRATVTLRIPPERFEAVIAKFKDFGTVRNQTLGSEDVTKAYVDLETRLKSKEILAERLRKLLAEAKGNVKELMEVEVQLGATNEAIEQLKGEMKYYDNLVGLSTITLRISEKDLGQPFEIVQTLQSNIALTARDPDDVYAKAQKEILDAGGQVVDSRMTRQSDGTSTGTVRGRVDSDKFPALREALKRLGVVTNDTVNQQKTARGGHEGAPRADAPLRKEQAVVDFSVSSPPLFVTRRSQILVETAQVETAYQNARRAIEAAGGKIVDGSLTGRTDGMSATLKAQIDADKFADLVLSLKSAGEVKNANISHVLPAVSSDGAPQLLRERAEIELALVSPPKLIGEQHGVLKTIRDTFANSWAGLLWSIEKLFVGVSLAGPWIAVLGVAWILWRRARRKKAATPAA